MEAVGEMRERGIPGLDNGEDKWTDEGELYGVEETSKLRACGDGSLGVGSFKRPAKSVKAFDQLIALNADEEVQTHQLR